ncbi:metalloendopeptidase mitochondrial, partial [Brachionus plicatilis]
IPPILWFIIKPVSKLGSILLGRGLRRWLKSPANLHRKQATIEHFRNRKKYYILGISGLGAGCYGYYTSHLEIAPITHRKRFILFNSDHLKEIEEFEKKNILESCKDKVLAPDHKYTKHALRIANRLFAANMHLKEVKDIKWKLTVIESDIVNACAFPNGDVFVFTGLMDFVKNDDELAFIIAHEMSHSILQHGAEQMSHSRIIDVISIALSLLIWSLVPTDASSILVEKIAENMQDYFFSLPYGRILEKEADIVGMILSARACFDVRYSSFFWKRMNEQSKEDQVPEFLSTHPSNVNRAQDLEDFLPQALKIRDECKCYRLPENMNIPKSFMSAKISN